MAESAKGVSPVLLVVLRLYLGVIFANSVKSKLLHFDTFPGQMENFVRLGLERAPLWYQSFINGVVLQHVQLFATLITAGEACVAVSMLAGLFVRLGGLVAFFMLVNYMLMKGMWWWSPPSNDGAQSIIAIVVAIGAAGRYWGLDALLARRWPKSFIW